MQAPFKDAREAQLREAQWLASSPCFFPVQAPTRHGCKEEVGKDSKSEAKFRREGHPQLCGTTTPDLFLSWNFLYTHHGDVVHMKSPWSYLRFWATNQGDRNCLSSLTILARRI